MADPATPGSPAPVTAVTTDAAPAGTTPASANTDASQEASSARLTLALDDAPLLQILHLLGTTGPARFRLGAPPDAVVSVRWNDEDPFASLDELVRRAGWRLQRDGTDYFLLPQAATAGAGVPAGAWAQWTKATPPPRASLNGPDDSMKVKLHGTLADPLASGSPTGAATGKSATPIADAASWNVLASTVEATRAPGLAVQATPMPGQITGPLWLRCRMPLAVVPHGARLFLESTEPCDVLVNGAPLARGWSGLRAFDMEPLLRRGTNVIAVRWDRTNSAEANKKSAALPLPSSAPQPTGPMLRYEWIFDGGTPGGGLPGENESERG